MDTDPVILVGLRLGEHYRDRNWQYAKRRWEQTLGWPVVEGHYDDPGPFSLARASNRAAAAAGDWRVAFYVGADFLLKGPGQARDAVALAATSGQLTFAHNILIQLSEQETLALIDGDPSATPATRERRHRNTYSGALAVPRTVWDAVGGFDERFVDWGWDDLAFWSACCALGGGFQRVDGAAYHLWHPRSWETNEGNPRHAANQDLGQRYLAAKDNREATLAILREPGAPLAK